MEVKPGYKQTEVGVIPEEWDVLRVRELVRQGPKNGYSGRSSKDARGTPSLSLAATSRGRLILNHATVKRLEQIIPADSPLFLELFDVLVQRSNTIELVGTTAVFNGPTGVYVYPDLMMRLRFRTRMTGHWFWRYANSSGGRSFFQSVAAGSSDSMPKISGEKLREMPVPVPPLVEQEGIVEALRDADDLIESLEQLLAKKRHVKQGAMQQLLTAKIRLPGFEGDWQHLSVKDVVTSYFCGPSPTCEERNLVGASEWGVLKTTAATKESGWDWRKHKVLPKSFWGKADLEVQVGDVIVTQAGPRHRVGVAAWVDYIPERIIVSGKMIGLRTNSERAVPLMLAAAIAARDAQTFLDQRTTGMAESQVNFENAALLETPIGLPLIEEQRAVARVLSDMDIEIAALERRRDKTKQIRQGMMQSLLTGRVRLVNPPKAEAKA